MRTRGKAWRRLAAAAVVAGATIPAALRLLRSAGRTRRTVDMRMTLVIERPVHEVFEFCRDFENFPRTMDLLLSVEDTQDGRSHWAVRSPTGRTIEWDATVTKYVPNAVIGWNSVPGSPVEASGLMRFFPLAENETRVDVTLRYMPLHTDLTEAIHALFHPSNTERLRSEVASASRAMATPETPS
jgi:uncharacterized membrane protein